MGTGICVGKRVLKRQWVKRVVCKNTIRDLKADCVPIHWSGCRCVCMHVHVVGIYMCEKRARIVEKPFMIPLCVVAPSSSHVYYVCSSAKYFTPFCTSSL